MLSQDKILLKKKNLKKDKRAVSVVIGYVLLIAIVVSMSLIVYQFLKAYVPQEEVECPEGTAIIIKDYVCTPDINQIKLTLHNKGLFDIDGLYIRATNAPQQEIATVNLISGSAYMEAEINAGQEYVIDLSYGDTQIYSVEVLPYRLQEKEGFVICNNALTKQDLDNCN